MIRYHFCRRISNALVPPPTFHEQPPLLPQNDHRFRCVDCPTPCTNTTTGFTAYLCALSCSRLYSTVAQPHHVHTCRPGSTTAALFALREAPLPERGLRVSLGGVQVGVGMRWVPCEARDQTGFPQDCEVPPVPSLPWLSFLM